MTVIGIYTFYISDDPYFLKGAEQATILKNNDETVIALVNGEAITKELFESSKALADLGQTQKSDEEILASLIKKMVLYKEAVEQGYTASDEEIDNYVEMVEEAIKTSPDLQTSIANYIDSRKMTEEEYWEIARDKYSEILTVDKMYKDLKEKYYTENGIQFSDN